jgi:hypothetical protein
MTSPLAFRATYSEVQPIKTRGVVKFVFEVPLAEADAAYRVLGGFPNPAAETWVAIARLKDNHEGDAAVPSTLAAKTDPSPVPNKRLVQQAAIACGDPLFQTFLKKNGAVINNAEDTAVIVRKACGVTSRSEIIPGSPAAAKWEKLTAEFLVWKRS